MMTTSRPSGMKARAALQEAVLVDDIDDAVAVRADDRRDIVVTAPVHVYIAGAVTEAVAIAVPDDGLIAFTNDGAIRLADDGLIAFAGFVAFRADLVDPV